MPQDSEIKLYHVHNYDQCWKCECGYVLPENLRRDQSLGKTSQFE